MIQQDYTEENDLQFIRDLTKYLSDSRYIRVNDKLLIIVYRPGLLPDCAKTIGIWRSYCVSMGIGDIYVLGAQVFGLQETASYGLDGIVEFPPHQIFAHNGKVINDELRFMNKSFAGAVVDYEAFVTGENYRYDTDYTLYKGVAPAWDNTPRNPLASLCLHNASPELYYKWLRDEIEAAGKPSLAGDNMVFINVCNEWAERAYLEPDRKFGYAYLEATRNALQDARHSPK